MAKVKLTKQREAELVQEINEALNASDSETKVRITAMIDLDILNELKKKAKKDHTKYQTLMNSILREALFERNDLEKRVEKIERMLKKKAS